MQMLCGILDFARIFDRDWFVEPLFNHIDILATGPDSSGYMHANTHVPQVVGFAHVASVLNSNDTERARLYNRLRKLLAYGH